MERVAFLIERTGERITCLLNPEFVETRRQSGVRARRDSGGFMATAGRTDHPLIATGGGVTEIDLRLLFDVDIAELERGPPMPPPPPDVAMAPVIIETDVRELTRPIWNLSENALDGDFSAPPSVRFIWGKSWNIPGVIVHVAERLERFTANGVPQRSWMALRLRRVDEPDAGPAPPLPVTPLFEAPTLGAAAAQDQYQSVDVPVDDQGAPLDRLDQICAEHYGNPGLAPALANFNGLEDMLTVPQGAQLSLPPVSVLTGGG